MDTDAFIRANYGRMSSTQIAEALGGGWYSAKVRVRAQRLGIVTPRNPQAPKRKPARAKAVAGRGRVNRGPDPKKGPSPAPVAPVSPPRKRGKETPQERAIRWSLEAYIGGRPVSDQIRCVCGRPGAPVHCAQHKAFLEREEAA